MIKGRDKELINKLESEEISKKKFLKKFSIHITDDENFKFYLEQSSIKKNKDFLDDILFLGYSFKLFKANHVKILSSLIIEDWHERHEDIALLLEELKDPYSVDFLYKAIFCNYEYLEWDYNFAFEVKCIWGLGEIRNQKAIDYLQLLTKSSNDVIKKNAIYQLERIKKMTDALNIINKFREEGKPIIALTEKEKTDLLKKAWNTKNEELLEKILFVFNFNSLEKSQIQLLNELLLCNWHKSHEEIALKLGFLQDPSSVEFLYKAISHKYEYLNDDFIVEEQCVLSLGEIANKKAIDYLQLLTKSSNELIKKNAINQLKWIQSR